MIAGAGAEGCFLIPFTLSMEIVGIKVILVQRKKKVETLFIRWIYDLHIFWHKHNIFQFFLTLSRSVTI